LIVNGCLTGILIIGIKNPLYSNEEPLKLGIVGIGGVAQGKHLPALFRLGILGYPIKLVAITEINEEVKYKVSNLLNCKAYSNYIDMYEKEDLEAIEVLIPPGPPKGDVIREAFNRGIHVLAEKPLLFTTPSELDKTLEEAECLCKYAEEKGIIFSMGFSKRFSPPYNNAKVLIDEGSIGKISIVTVKMCQGWSKANLLENQICHIIDILRYLVGEIKTVYANARNSYNEQSYPIDGLVATLEFENGVIGTLCVNSSNPSLKPWERVEIFGEKKWLAVEDGTNLILYDSEEGPSKKWQPVWPNTLLLDEHFSGFVGEIADFADSVRGKKSPKTTGWDGYKALEVAYALHLSYQQKKAISLPLR